MLVQKGYFNKIEVFFLIVGHTHASIDQYFNVIAGEINWCAFLGSPLALEALLMRKPIVRAGECYSATLQTSRTKAKPLLVKKICVVYDMKTVLTPLINKSLKYYPVPHRFVFEKYQTVCAMQYAVYSDQELLPRRPTIVPGNL
jgi:hypothetical protein